MCERESCRLRCTPCSCFPRSRGKMPQRQKGAARDHDLAVCALREDQELPHPPLRGTFSRAREKEKRHPRGSAQVAEAMRESAVALAAQ